MLLLLHYSFLYIYNCYLCTEIYSWCSSELYFYIYSCTCIYLLSVFFLWSEVNLITIILSCQYSNMFLSFFLFRREFISYFFMCQIDTRSHCIFMPMIIFDKRSKVNLKLVIHWSTGGHKVLATNYLNFPLKLNIIVISRYTVSINL